MPRINPGLGAWDKSEAAEGLGDELRRSGLSAWDTAADSPFPPVFVGDLQVLIRKLCFSGRLYCDEQNSKIPIYSDRVHTYVFCQAF